MSERQIHEVTAPKATLALSDADDLRLFGGLTYIVGLLSSAATLHQTAIVTHTKLINNDISAQKNLNKELLHVGDVSLSGIHQTEYIVYHIIDKKSTYGAVINSWDVIKKKDDPPPYPIGTKHVQRGYSHYIRICHKKNSYQTCKQQTKMNDAIQQGKELQECRDALQSRYGLAAKSAEMNNGDVLQFIQDVNQLTTACGSVLDTLTKMTNVLVIPV